MKKCIVALWCGIMLVFASCEQEDMVLERTEVQSQVGEDSPIYILNSKENKGFSAVNLRIADFPGIRPDFIIIPQTNLTGDVMSPFLSHPNLEKRFILAGEFEDSNSARSYFDSFEGSPREEDLRQFALNIKPNQVWFVRTQLGNFCKIWIMDTHIDRTTTFVEIKFRAEKIF